MLPAGVQAGFPVQLNCRHCPAKGGARCLAIYACPWRSAQKSRGHLLYVTRMVFMKLLPSLMVIVAYAIAFYMLSLALCDMPVGVAYAVWSGVGTAIVAIAGTILFGERLTIVTIAGLALVVAGVILLELGLNVVPESSMDPGGG